MPKTKSWVDRKIYFYRANVGLDPSGRPLPFEPSEALKHVRTLGWRDSSRYLTSTDGRVTCCWIDRARPRQRIRLGNIRRADLPLVERRGKLASLDIPRVAGLAEVTHMVVFPRNIIGQDFNFHGPRLSRFEEYLESKCPTYYDHVRFEPLLRRDVAEQLDDLEDIRLLQLKIRASYAHSIAKANQDLGSAFEAAARVGRAEDIEIVLTPRPYSRKPLHRRLFGTVRALLERNDIRTEATRLKVKGMSRRLGRVSLVDLLSDQLIAVKQIVRQDGRSRGLQMDSAYDSIIAAHNELREQLHEAASVLE